MGCSCSKPPAPGSLSAGTASFSEIPKPDSPAKETKSVPRLFIIDGCPFCLKVLTFLADANLFDKVAVTNDTRALREYLAEKLGKPASFPALEMPDRIIPESDEIIEYLAQQNNVDVTRLIAFNAYLRGVFPRYKMMLGYIVKAEGGFPKVFPAIGVQNVLVLGAGGMVGQRLSNEASLRGHKVTCASRSGDVQVDANDTAAVAAALKTHATNVLIVALGPSRTDSSAPPLKDTYAAILAAVRGSGARVFFVGGAASLKVSADGPMLMDTPDFPASVQNEARQHWDALVYLQGVDDVTWTSLSPAPLIRPGKRTGKVALGDDGVLVGGEVSAEDFAVAALDEIAAGKYVKKRFAVAGVPP